MMIDLERLEALPLFHRIEVPGESIDAMGHMNVRWYMAFYDQATWGFFAFMGLDQDYYRSRNAGGFALKHFIQYLAEVHAGETLAVRTRLLGRSERRLHYMHFMINETSGRLASTLEALGSHADMSIRRTSPIPADLAARIDTILEAHRSLDWSPPVSGLLAP